MITQTQDQAPLGISVVIPVFNGGPDLEKCLAAISASSQPILECILVDDASTDGMVDTAAERHGVRVIRLEQQCGPAMAISSTHLAFYRYVSHKRNIAFAIAVTPMQVIFFLGCAVSIPLAFVRHHLGRGHAQIDQQSSADC